MKRIITFLLLALSLSVFSQSVNLDRFLFKVSYVILPPNPVVDKTNRTFTVTTMTSGGLKLVDSEDYIDENLSIPGFRTLATKGYLNITVDLKNPEIVSTEIKKIENKVKDRKGVETIEYSYKGVIVFKGEGGIKIACAADPSLNGYENFKDNYKDESPVFSEYSDANRYLGNAASTAQSIYTQSFTGKFNSKLSKEYGFVINNTSDILWILASKKHPEFENNNNAFSNVKAVFDFMKYDQDVSILLPELQNPIKYFEEIDKKYTSVEKPDKKMRYGAYYNLATIYHYLDMPDESDIWCDKLIANEYDASDGKLIKRKNEYLRESFAKNQVKSRHMDVTQQVVAQKKPEKMNYDSNYLLKNDPEFIAVSLILASNETVSGYTKITDIDNLDQKIAISVPDEKGNHNYAFRTYFVDQVTRLVVNENDFFSAVSFKESSKASTEKPSVKFVREIVNGKTISLYQYFTGEIIIKKQGDALGYSTNSTGWQMNSRTKFIELANSCPKLAARANNKEFQNNLNSFRTFIEALDMCN